MGVSVKKIDASSKSNHKCAHCGSIRKELTLEHIFPQSFFDDETFKNNDFNLTILCKDCNSEKADKLLSPEEFREFYKYIDKRYIEAYYKFYVDCLWRFSSKYTKKQRATLNTSAHLKKSNNALISKNNSLMQGNSQLKHDNKVLRNKIAAVEKKGNGLDKERSELSDVIEKQKKEIAELKKRNSELGRKIKLTEKENDELRRTNISLNEKISRLKQNISIMFKSVVSWVR